MEELRFFVVDRINGTCFYACCETEVERYQRSREYVVVDVRTLHYWNAEGKHVAEYI